MSLSKMLFKLWKNIFFLVAITPAIAMGQSDAKTQLELFVDQVLSAAGDFQQSIASDEKNNEIQSGEFAFQRPGKFKWDVKQPYEQLVISNGQTIYQYDPDLDQVTQRSAGTAVDNSPASLLFGAGSLADAFNINNLPDKDNVQWLQAIPKQKEAGFVHVDIGFVDGLPVQLNLLDSFGQTTKIQFSNFKINPDLAAESFDFSVPDGVDLVKMD